MRLAMGRKTTMARNRWKVLALGSLHAYPPRGHGVPAFPGRRDRALAGRAAQATASRRTRGGGVHLVVPGRPGPGGERHSGTSVPLLSQPLGASDARRGRPRPDATRPPLPRNGAVLRGGRHGRGLAAVPAPALRRHPRALAVSVGAVRLGRATGSPRRPGHHVLRGGAPVGEDRDAVPQRFSQVGGAAVRSRGGDLVIHGGRSAPARASADRGHPLHHQPPSPRPARRPAGRGSALHGAVRGPAGGAQGRELPRGCGASAALRSGRPAGDRGGRCGAGPDRGPRPRARSRRPGRRARQSLGGRAAGGVRRRGCVRTARGGGPAGRYRGYGSRVDGGDEPPGAAPLRRGRRASRDAACGDAGQGERRPALSPRPRVPPPRARAARLRRRREVAGGQPPQAAAHAAARHVTEIEQQVARRRTFAIISHPDAGKTTLTEKLLLYGGAIQLAGAVKARGEQRRARSDWMKVERERGISVASSVMTFEHDGFAFNLLDTPGHEDFSEDTYRTLTAVDSAVMVLDAAKGIETQTRKLFEVCRLRDVPIVTFINKMDRDGREPFELLDEVEQTLALDVTPASWPIGMGRDFLGCYDLRRDELVLTERGEKASVDAGVTCTGLEDEQLDELFPESAA